jgi:hypothetical protein
VQCAKVAELIRRYSSPKAWSSSKRFVLRCRCSIVPFGEVPPRAQTQKRTPCRSGMGGKFQPLLD